MKINYSKEDKEILHTMIDKLIESGENSAVYQNAHIDYAEIDKNPEMGKTRLKIKRYRIYIEVDDNNERTV